MKTKISKFKAMLLLCCLSFGLANISAQAIPVKDLVNPSLAIRTDQTSVPLYEQQYFPQIHNTNYSFVRFFYTPEEVGVSKTIKGISFKMAYPGPGTYNTLTGGSYRIYVREASPTSSNFFDWTNTWGYLLGWYTSASMPSGDTTTANGWKKVYDTTAAVFNNIVFKQDSLLTFNFSQNFQYVGTGCLEIQMVFDYGATTPANTSYPSFYTVHGNRTAGNPYEWDAAAVLPPGRVARTMGTTAPAATLVFQGRQELPYAQIQYIPVNMENYETRVSQVTNYRLSDTLYNILQANMVTAGTNNPLSVSEFVIKPLAGYPSAGLKGIRIYNTGSKSTFDMGDMTSDNLVGRLDETFIVPFLNTSTYTIPFSSGKQLSEGDNYFWVIYDIDPFNTPEWSTLTGVLVSARVGNVIQNINLPTGPGGNPSPNVFINYQDRMPDEIIIPDEDKVKTITCTEDPTVIITAPVAPEYGTVGGYQWYKWDGENEEYVEFTGIGAKTNIATIDASDIFYKDAEDNVVNTNKVKIKYFPPSGTNNFPSPEIEYTVTVEYPNPAAISADVKHDYIICYDDQALVFDIPINGIVKTNSDGSVATDAYKWQYKLRNSSDEWRDTTSGSAGISIINTTTSTKLTISTKDSTIQYKLLVYAPRGCMYNDTLVDEYSFNAVYQTPLTSAKIEYSATNPNLNNIYAGNNLEFKVTTKGAVESLLRYQWQINNKGFWADIPQRNTIGNSANTKTLKLQANTINNFGEVRVVVSQIEGCNYIVMPSDSIVVNVIPSEFYFTEQPAAKTTLCNGETYTLNCAYYGNMISGQWYKNGILLKDSKDNPYTEPILEIKKVAKENAGIYTYKLVYSNDKPAAVTEPAELFLAEPAMIYAQTDQVFAEEGSTAILQVESNHVGQNPPYYDDGYQWYTINGGKKTKLEDSYKYKGTKSNMLVIYNLTKDDYIYNGGYYLEIAGRCDTVKSQNLHILPDNTLEFINQPTDVIACDDKQFELSCLVVNTGSGNEYIYTWYKDAVEVVNGGRISGAKTNILRVSDADSTDIGTYYVTVYEKGLESRKIQSDNATVTFDYIRGIKPEQDTIEVKEGENIKLSFKFEKGLKQTLVTVQPFFEKADGEVVALSDEEIDNTDAQSFTREISLEEVTAENAGRYEYRAKTNCGEVVDTLYLVVTDSDGNPLPAVTSITSHDIAEYILQPNPTNDLFNLRFNATSVAPMKIEILSMSGQTVGVIFEGIPNMGINQFEYKFSNTNLATGTYFVRILQNSKAITKRIVLTR